MQNLTDHEKYFKIREITCRVLRDLAKQALQNVRCQFPHGDIHKLVHDVHQRLVRDDLAQERFLDKFIGTCKISTHADYKAISTIFEVFWEAVHKGYILPLFLIEQAWSEHRIAQNTGDKFKFTQIGFSELAGDGPALLRAGTLREALNELFKRDIMIDPSTVELLAEAQKCWFNSCYRAAMVLIGLANEKLCIGLVDVLVDTYPYSPRSSSPKDIRDDWNRLADKKSMFSGRWRPMLRILYEIKKKIRSHGQGKPWFQWWQGIPGSLETLGEAVRLSRNAAAHDPDCQFNNAEVSLLLHAMPQQIQMIHEIKMTIENPPSGLTFPQL